MQHKPGGEERARIGALLERSAAGRKSGATALIVLLLLGLMSSRALLSFSDQKTSHVAVSVVEEILLSQSGTSANLKIRLSSGVNAQVWGDSTTSCGSPTGSLSESASGTYTIALNTIPFGSNQNNFVCVKSSDSTLNAHAVWPHTPASVAFVQQPANTAAGTTITPAVTVKVLDSTGTLISSSGASIALAIGTNPGGGTLSGTVTRTAVDGIATFNDLSINKTGTGYTLAASSTGLPGATSNTFNITPGTATKLALNQQPSATAAGNAINPAVTVLVQDANGNTVTGDTSTVAIAISSGGVLTGTASVAASNGVATFSNLVPTKTGSFTLTATDGSLTSTTSNSFTVNNAAANKVVFTTQPGGGTGGTTWSAQPVVTVEDQFNNTVTTGTGNNATITLVIGTNPGGGTLTCTTNPLNATSGVASFSGCNINKPGSNYTLTATSTGLTLATSSTFNITVGTAAKLAFTTQPGGGTGGTAWTTQPAMTVQDAGGNTVTSSASITLAIGTNPGSGTLTCTSNPLGATSGVATFAGCKIDKAANGYTLNATSSGLTSATSSTFNITVGTASQLAFTTQPAGCTAGNNPCTAQPVATVEDAGGNKVTTSSALVTLGVNTGPSGDQLTCTGTGSHGLIFTASSGVVTATGCSLSKAGATTLNATSTGLTTAISAPFTVN